MDVSLTVFSSRESAATLLATLNAAKTACDGYSYQINLLLNGNEAHAETVTQVLLSRFNGKIKIWFCALADKANCWNQYCYVLHPTADYHFFIDGYTLLEKIALANIISCAATDKALAYTGVPSSGRSSKKLARQMLNDGGLHGNLFMLPKHTLAQLTASGMRLPVGIYRTDSTIGAAINFNFAPQHNNWQSNNIRVVANATWQHTPLKWYRFTDIKTQVKRYLRQAAGQIENKAIKEIFAEKKLAVTCLPEFAHDLCLNYLQQHPLSWLDKATTPGLAGLHTQLLQKKAQEQHMQDKKDILRELSAR